MVYRAKSYAATLLTVFLLWQVGAVVHLVFVTHTFCPIHRSIEHVDARTGKLLHHEHGSSQSSGDNGSRDTERGCFVLTAMTRASVEAQTLSAIPRILPAPLLFEIPSVVSEFTAVLRSERYRFHVAPSHSPPV